MQDTPMQDLMTDFEKERLNYSIRLGIFAGLIGFICSWLFYDTSQPVLLFFNFNTAVQSDGINIGLMCLVLTGAISLACCLVTYKNLSLERDDVTLIERVAMKGRQNFVARVTVSIITTIIILAIAWIVWILIGFMFTNLRVPFANALLITTLYSAVIATYVTRWIVDLDSSRMMWLAIVTFILGLMGSFLLADDPEWWRESLSYLGIDTGADTLFRWSVISVGIIILSLWRDLVNTLNILAEAKLIPRWSIGALAFGSTASSLGIIGVGIFLVDVTPFSHFMHNLSVQGAVVIFLIGMLGIRWLIPNIYHPNFIRLGYIYASIVGIIFLLYQFTNMLNFVALEIFSFAVFTVWIHYLNQYTLLYIRQQDITVIEEAVAQANRPLWIQIEEALQQV
ncbi:MAG: hypothetical protein AAFV93_14525 [Chloroflexota bacterium]